MAALSYVVYPELVEGLPICHSEALEESAQAGLQLRKVSTFVISLKPCQG